MSEENFNELTPAENERLAILMEEMAEAIQIIGKIQRHGYFSHHPDDLVTTNQDYLEKELGDVEYAMRAMIQAGDIRQQRINDRAAHKGEMIKPYLHHN